MSIIQQSLHCILLYYSTIIYSINVLKHSNNNHVNNPLQLPQPYATAPTEGIPGFTAELKAQVIIHALLLHKYQYLKYIAIYCDV